MNQLPITRLVAEDEIQLIAEDGNLCLPDGTLLMYFYPAGDMDLIPWGDEQKDIDRCPREWSAHLSRAIFDAVETGDISHNHGKFLVVLPDATTFDYLHHVR